MLQTLVVLAEDEWSAAAEDHRARVRRWTGPHLERRQAGLAHPVLDFLFTYYAYRPAQLERWHPGPDVLLRGSAALSYLGSPGYVWDEAADGVRLEPTALPPRFAATAGFVRSLLAATASRPPRL